MTDIDWAALAEPFPDSEVRQRPGAAKWPHKESCQKQQCRETADPDKHHQFSYVDARAVAQRLDDVLTPAGWSFTWSHIPGEAIVHGHLDIGGIVREDAGYPNSDRDEEPMKAAVSDALKRCAVLFGIGRHLYEDNTATRRPVAARPQPVREDHTVTPIRRPVDADLLEPDDEDVAELHAGIRDDLRVCPIHDVNWNGSPGDLWHKDAEGRYCRHPDNVKKARQR